MPSLIRTRLAGAFALILLVSPGLAAEPRAPGERVDEYLETGQVAAGAAELTDRLERDPSNDDLRFALGFTQFAHAVERLGQAWYRYGLRPQSQFARNVPFARLPVPANPEPEAIDWSDARAVLERMVADLDRAERTLAAIDDESVELTIHPGRGHLDFNANRSAEEEEALWRILAAVNPRSGLDAETAAAFRVDLDAADVHWLRGYCHLLSALLQFHLSHDAERLFNHTAHLFFARPDTPYPFLVELRDDSSMSSTIIDAAALIHLLDLPVTEPERRKRALDHLQAVIEQSRRSWALIGKETDDEREWIPNPDQTGVIPGAAVSAEMIARWHDFLDEAESILSGETLVPFWRGSEPVGINLRRALLESERLDLLRWIQGTAAQPWFEDGEITQAGFWRGLRQAFDGRFIGFALWFN